MGKCMLWDPFWGKIAARVLASVFLLCSLDGFSQQPTWNYDYDKGPDVWERLKPDFQACGQGQHQSPIAISSAEVVNDQRLPSLRFLYQSTQATALYQAPLATITFASTPGQLLWGEDAFTLNTVVPHMPAEHRIAGTSYPLELQWVHSNAKGQKVIVALFVTKGHAHVPLNPLFLWFDRFLQRLSPAPFSLDLPSVFHDDPSYYTYAGSLTAPPCTENVAWILLKKPVEASLLQLERVQRVLHMNQRPTQPVQGRRVRFYESKDEHDPHPKRDHL